MTDIFDFSQKTNLVARAGDEQPMVQFQHGATVILVVDCAGIPFLRALPSLLSQQLVREIVIVDRGAPQELIDCLQKVAQEFPVIRLILNKKHLSKIEAQNLAAKRAFGRYLLFVEQHAVLPKDATLRLLSGFAGQNSKSHIISAQLENLNAKTSSRLLDPKEALQQALGLKLKTSYEEKAGNHVYHVGCVSEGCYMIERSQFWLNGGLDPKLKSAAVLDLCLKMHLQGGGVYQMADCPVRLYSQSKHENKKQNLANSLGLINYYYKHYRQAPTRRWLMPLAVILFAKGLMKKISASFHFKKSKVQPHEPSLIELLQTKDLSRV